MSMLQKNLIEVRENIAAAAQKSNRSADDITLIAVTKTIAPERINELITLGVTRLGENKVQEMTSKYGLFTPEPEWHMIGHLQTNKVKYIIDKVKMIQSVDSLPLAAEINKRANQIGRVMDILIEINIGEEDTKYGIKLNQLECFLEQMIKFTNVCVKGLMCVAPYVKNAEDNRLLYKKMSKSLVDIRDRFYDNTDMRYLSMGMTHDYTVAIEEGANMVRIGTALFGERDYKPVG